MTKVTMVTIKRHAPASQDGVKCKGGVSLPPSGSRHHRHRRHLEVEGTSDPQLACVSDLPGPSESRFPSLSSREDLSTSGGDGSDAEEGA